MFDQLIRKEPPPKPVVVPKPVVEGERPPYSRRAANKNSRYAFVENPWGVAPAEAEILKQSSEGFTVYEIAETLGVSPRGLYILVGRAVKKMSARNPMHAVILWDRFLRSPKVT